MPSEKLTNLKNILLLLFIIFGLLGTSITAQNIDTRFIESPDNDCLTNQFCALLQVKGNNGAAYLGISSIRFDYDPSVIQFNGDHLNITQGSFIPHNFDNSITGGECSNDFSPYTPIYFDGTNAGKFLMTIVLSMSTIGNNVFACPNIENQWTDVSTICFELIDPSGNPNLEFIGTENGPSMDSAGCSFNDDSNDPSLQYDNGTFTDFTTPIEQICPISSVSLSLKVALQGALLGNTNSLMRDDLREQNLLPFQEPYTALNNFNHAGGGGGETLDPNLLSNLGNLALVDWLFLGLYTASNPNVPIATQAVLVNRQHQVIDSQGNTSISFPNIPTGNYYVGIRHRNHFGIMTKTPINFNGNNVFIDFTDINTELWGSNSTVLMDNSFQALWTGNTNNDEQIIFQGNNNDTSPIFFEILTANGNAEAVPSYIYGAYSQNDLNLDGQVIYQGSNNENNSLFFNILSYPDNTSGLSNYLMQEQFP